MKKKTLTPQEEFTGQAPEISRKTRAMKVSPKAWLAAVLSIVMSLSLIGLYYLSFLGNGKTKKIVLFYCEYRFFPYVSMGNSLASAGFDYVIMQPPANSDSAGKDAYAIPESLKGRQIVVAAFGKNAFKIMDEVSKTDDPDVIGYCLINPEYPGNAALEGYGRYFPQTPVAIFSYDGKTEDQQQTEGAPLLYEKLSGADTLYGVPAVSGTLIKNKVYITPDQNRYLSLSSMKMGSHVVRYSPLFENELARYLGITYGDGVSAFRIKAWFTGVMFTTFAALAFLALFVFLIPVRVSDKGAKELKGRDSLGTILFFGLSAWIGLTITVMTFFSFLEEYARYAVVLTPAFLTAAMALMRLPFLLSKKTVYRREKLRKNDILAPLVMGVCEVVFVLGIVLVYTDISGIDKDSMNLAAALIVFVVSSISALALTRADRKSRFVGEGPASYFGNPVYFIETIIPAGALLVISIIRGSGSEICFASMALACGLIPFAAAVTIKRFSDFFEAAGVVYGTLMAILVYIAL